MTSHLCGLLCMVRTARSRYLVIRTCLVSAVKFALQVAKLGFHLFCFNPLTTNAKSCSDLAEIFSVASFIYLKNIIFYALIFYLALLKSY
jgi:hypothetical protein